MSELNSDIVVDEVFPHAPETIWKALTTGALMSRWIHMPVTGFAPVIGNQFTYQTKPAGEWDGFIRCEVLDVVPNARLVHTWRGGHETNIGYGSKLDTLVTYTLAEEANGTHLRVVHSGFELPRNETAYRNMSGGWKRVAQDLASVASEAKEQRQ
jgi:uncharacterized protein YndB with AHSA1/START domain